MGKKNTYHQYLTDTLGGLIDQLEISDLRKAFLKNRWLDQLLWLEGRATKERDRHYMLRLITIVGGVLVPALVGFNGFQSGEDSRVKSFVTYAAFGISQTVAISAAVEEFFGHGSKYRNYRNSAEILKITGWQFFQLAGPYHQYANHEAAYTSFAQHVEQCIQRDIEGFVTSFEEIQNTPEKEPSSEFSPKFSSELGPEFRPERSVNTHSGYPPSVARSHRPAQQPVPGSNDYQLNSFSQQPQTSRHPWDSRKIVTRQTDNRQTDSHQRSQPQTGQIQTGQIQTGRQQINRQQVGKQKTNQQQTGSRLIGSFSGIEEHTTTQFPAAANRTASYQGLPIIVNPDQ